MKIKGFTIVELLVVIAIILLLLSIIVPAIGTAKEVTRKVICANQQHTLHIGTIAHAAEHNGLLFGHPRILQSISDGWFSDWPKLSNANPSFLPYFENRDRFYCPSAVVSEVDDKYKGNPTWMEGSVNWSLVYLGPVPYTQNAPTRGWRGLYKSIIFNNQITPNL